MAVVDDVDGGYADCTNSLHCLAACKEKFDVVVGGGDYVDRKLK